MHGWLAAVICLLSVAAVLCAAYLLMRVLFPHQLEAIFAIGEEKLSLTKADVRVDYNAAQPADGEAKQQPQLVRADTAGRAADVSNADTYSPADTTGSECEAGQNLPRAGSADSLASDTSVMDLQPDVSAIGQVEVGLEYERDISELVVSIIQARDLAQASPVGCDLDFYAKVSLSPDAANVSSATKLIRKNPNPIIKERFLYSLEPHQLAHKTVQLHMYSIDRERRHKLIGQSEVRLADIDLQRPLRLWLNLRELDQKPSDNGELMFSLSYLPTAERLTVVIVKAKNLKFPQSQQESGDVLVMVHLIINGRRAAKKRTSVKRGETQPTYNEAMIFNVSQANLSSVQLRLTVAELGQDGKLSSIGHVIIGSQTGGTEMTHWQQMITSLRRPVAMWHHLRRK